MKPPGIPRRRFLATGALALSGVALGAPAYSKTFGKPDVVRIGLIGAGSRGVGLAMTLRKIPGFALVACCDTLPDHLANGLKEAAKGAAGYADYRKLLEDKKVDAVIIATPLHLHQPMAMDALAAGKHVYLEKSLAYDIPQARALLAKVRSTPKLVFQVGFQYRYYGLYHRVKEVLDQQWLGKVTHYECQVNMLSDWRQPNNDPKLERAINWRMYREYCGGPLSELCAHQIDMVHYLAGSRPEKVIGAGGINYWKDGRETYDHIRTVYDYPAGVQATFTSILSNAYNSYNIRILGEKGTISINRGNAFIYPQATKKVRGTVDGVTGATVTTPAEGQELTFLKPDEPRADPTVYALLDFIRCIRENKKPVSNVDTAYDATIAIHMGNLAAEQETKQIWKPEYSA